MFTIEPIIVEQEFKASVDKVWDAITKPELMKQWFFENIESFKPEVGFETQVNVEFDGKNYIHLWKVREVLIGKNISYDWKYAGYPGDSYVIFELFQKNELTKLVLTHIGHESFPQDNPDFSRESGINGWNYFICNSLKKFVDSNV